MALSFSEDDFKQISAALEKAGMYLNCPACLAGQMSIVDGYFSPHLSVNAEDAGKLLGERRIFPCLGITCLTCGYLRMHSLDALGIMHLFTKGEQPK